MWLSGPKQRSAKPYNRQFESDHVLETLLIFLRITQDMKYVIKINGKEYATAVGRQELNEWLEQIECEMGDKLTITIDIKK